LIMEGSGSVQIMMNPYPDPGGKKTYGSGSTTLFLRMFFLYFVQHCFICHPSDSAASGDAGIAPRTFGTLLLAARRSKHSAVDLIHRNDG
jgi:hypothetical protein